MLISFTDGSRPIPPWKKFTHTKIIPCLVGSGNEEVHKITHTGIEKARDLFSSHEESDSKIIIFHAVSSDKVL